ncbi:BQ2448_3859 [Microbotryum intermedium]|uniref:BQ2448_3859 protein n=1 Tax=Microbotryum intermedium TaxID=269621 RepID=A0A238FES3_9BASI|nr:BQ2448_3859 [Microbotryum intermedium]
MMLSPIKLLVLLTALSRVRATPWPPSIQDDCNWLQAWCSDCQTTSCGNLTSHKQQNSCYKTHCESHHPPEYPGPCKQWKTADKCMRSCQKKKKMSFWDERKCKHCCDMQGGPTEKIRRLI